MQLDELLRANDFADIPDLALSEEDIASFERSKVWKEVFRLYGQKVQDYDSILERHESLPEVVLRSLLAQRRCALFLMQLPVMFRQNPQDPTKETDKAEETVDQLIKELHDV